MNRSPNWAYFPVDLNTRFLVYYREAVITHMSENTKNGEWTKKNIACNLPGTLRASPLGSFCAASHFNTFPIN